MDPDTAKVVLGAATALLFASHAGFLALPALVPPHVLAARSSGAFGRAAWSFASGAGLGVAAWGATYLLAGEQKPLIWLAPLVVLVLGGTFVYRGSAPRQEAPA